MPLESRQGTTNGSAKPLEEDFAHTEAAIYSTSEAESDSVGRCATNVNPNRAADHGEFERDVAEAAAQLQEAAIHRTSEAGSDSVDRRATNVNPDETPDQGDFERLAAEAAAHLQEAAIDRTSEAEIDSVDRAAPNGAADHGEFERVMAEAAAKLQEAAIHRTSEAEADSFDRDATNINNNGTADQGEFERLVAEAAAQLPKPAQLASVPGLATVGDGISPPHSLEPDYPARRDALRGPRTMIKMSLLVVSILSMPIVYYFWMGAWGTVSGASPSELASFNSKSIIPPPNSSTEEETGERVAQRDAQTPIPAPPPAATTDRIAVEAPTPNPDPRPTATTGRTAVETQTPIPAPRPTATTDRTTVEAQTPSPPPAAASPTATTSRTAVAPASEQNVTPSDQRDADESVVLLKRGQELMRHGDLPAARLVLRHAAAAKNAEAALMLGSTYDPVTLRELRVYGFSADVGMARTWYEKAKELGSPEAAQRLDKLGH
jgi:hypothetical protein